MEPPAARSSSRNAVIRYPATASSDSSPRASAYRYTKPTVRMSKPGMMKPEDRDRWVSAWWELTAAEKNARLRGDDTNIRRRRDRADRRDIDRARRYEGLDSTDKLAEMLGRLDILNLTVSCKNTDHVNSIVSRLKQVRGRGRRSQRIFVILYKLYVYLLKRENESGLLPRFAR